MATALVMTAGVTEAAVAVAWEQPLPSTRSVTDARSAEMLWQALSTALPELPSPLPLQSAAPTSPYCVLPLCFAWTSVESDGTSSVAWGDYDGDGDLDLMAGNENAPKRLYRNDNGTFTPGAVWSFSDIDHTFNVVWGDFDEAGDLDLAAENRGSAGQPNRIYRNDSGAIIASSIWATAENDNTWSTAWGDFDGDGDLAVGNDTHYGCRSSAVTNSPHAVWKRRVAFGGPFGAGQADEGAAVFERTADAVANHSAIWTEGRGSLASILCRMTWA